MQSCVIFINDVSNYGNSNSITAFNSFKYLVFLANIILVIKYPLNQISICELDL